LLTASFALAQQAAQQAAAKAHRALDGHPDLSGLWTYAIDVAPVTLKKTVNASPVS